MSERIQSFIKSLSPRQKDLIDRIRDCRLGLVSLDHDQIMVSSEKPVKQEFLRQTGIDYREREIDQWLALAHWAHDDGKMTFEEAAAIEGPIWENPEILFQGPAVRAIQELSQKFAEVGIPQIVVSTRVPRLKESTIDWTKIHFPWISVNDIFIRNDPHFPGDTFKGLIVAEKSVDVHFDDSVSSAKSVLSLSMASAILFSRKLELGMIVNDRVIEFQGFDHWEKVQENFSIVSHNVDK